MEKTAFAIGLVSVFVFISIFSLFHSGLPPTHDGEYHVVRFYEFYKTFINGNIYPRWASDFNNGYGIPLFNFVYPLPNYIASLFHILGLSFIDAFKYELVIASFIGAIFFYLWSKIFWGNKGAIVTSIFYTFSPYHFVDIYIRGSVGEVWALAFFPAFLWSITSFIKSQNKLYFILSSVFIALIIFSHNILALMFFVFAISYVLFVIFIEKSSSRNLFLCILSMIFGIGLSSVFWMPAILELGYVRGLQIYSIKDNFPELFQLLIPSWGHGFSGQGLQDQMSFQIGITNLLAVFISFILAIYFFVRRIKIFYILVFFLIWFFILFFFMLPMSFSIWNIIPFMNYFQFPWRLLSLEILVSSFLSGSIIYRWNSKFLLFPAIFLPLFFSIGYISPPYFYNRLDEYYIKQPNFIYGTNSPGDFFNTFWMDKDLKKSVNKILFDKNITQKTNELILPTNYKATVTANSNTKAHLGISYFPGWLAYIDNKNVDITSDVNGLIMLDFPKGKHELEVLLSRTPIQKISELISIFSLLLLLLTYNKLKFYERKRKTN